MRASERRTREKGSGMDLVRDLVDLDLRITDAAFEHLAPELRAFLCAPALLASFILERLRIL